MGNTSSLQASKWDDLFQALTRPDDLKAYLESTGAAVPPQFFGSPHAATAVRWARRLRSDATSRTLVAENVDLLLDLPVDCPTTRTERSHKRGDSLAQYLMGLGE